MSLFLPRIPGTGQSPPSNPPWRPRNSSPHFSPGGDDCRRPRGLGGGVVLPFPMACARLTPTAPCGRRIRGLLEPPTAPPGRHRLGARASRLHPVPLAAAELQCGAAGSHPVGGNSIGQAEAEPWRRSRLIQVGEMAEAVPGLVRAGRPRSQEAIISAGGTPALPASLHPMTSSHQGHKSAEAFWCCLWLKEVHLSSCLFVSIRGSSS